MSCVECSITSGPPGGHNATPAAASVVFGDATDSTEMTPLPCGQEVVFGDAIGSPTLAGSIMLYGFVVALQSFLQRRGPMVLSPDTLDDLYPCIGEGEMSTPCSS